MIRKSLFTLTLSATLAFFIVPVNVSAQAMESVEPFKVGTFAINDIPTVGLVVRDDQLVIDLAAANRAMELIPQYSKLSMPENMLGLIEQYEYGLKYRIYEVVNWLVEKNQLSSSNQPSYVHPVNSVDIMAPIQYPSKIMNAAVNFYTHACEGCNDDQLATRTRERQENRGVPYLFLKPTRGVVIGDGDDIIMPYGRDRIEWEVEMAIRLRPHGQVHLLNPRIRSRVRLHGRDGHFRSWWTSSWRLRLRFRTGSSARAMIRLRHKVLGSYRKSFMAIQWNACTRLWSSAV